MDHLDVERRGRVAWLTLNRPDALNALNARLIGEISAALDDCEKDPAIGCIVLTGSDKAFAAGADIKEAASRSFPGTYLDDFLADWDRIARCRKPLVAAVAGYALGGGCEIALMCDIIIAADNARFGLPEAKIGVMPGAGGTQRVTRIIGKPKAMELCLTGRQMAADEAERCGLVARVVPASELLKEAGDTAARIASMSLPSVMAIKESIDRSFETSLSEGLRFERRLFQSLFATHDQKEGMAAFVDKRVPRFRHA